MEDHGVEEPLLNMIEDRRRGSLEDASLTLDTPIEDETYIDHIDHIDYTWGDYWADFRQEVSFFFEDFYMPFSYYLIFSVAILFASSLTLSIMHAKGETGHRTCSSALLISIGAFQVLQWIIFGLALYRVSKAVSKRNVFLGKVWQM
jgi:hypothetical protein